MIRKYLYLNGLSTISVVLFHTAGMGFVAMFAWAHRYLPASASAFDQVGSPAYYFMRIIEQLIMFCIPAFMLLSGYFISTATGKTQRTVGWGVVLARLKMLGIPYLVWSFVVFALKALEGDIYRPGVYLRMLLTGQANEVFYFIPLLLQLYILSPILVLAARKNWKALLLITGLLQLLQQLTAYPEFLGMQDPTLRSLPYIIPKWFFLARLFWFSLGVVIGLIPQEFKAFITRYQMLFWGVVILSIPLGIAEWEYFYAKSGLEWLATRETLIDSLYSLAFILGFLGNDRLPRPGSKLINNLGTKSYGIYLTHAIVIELTARLIYRFAPQVLGMQWLFLPVIFIVGLGVPLLMMWIVDKSFFRRAYPYLFG